MAGQGAPMNGLRFHWSNPKFDGLPWPAAYVKPKTKNGKPRCCKKVYSQPEAQRECADLRSSDAGCDWFYRFCSGCNGFHVCRERQA